ncbi:hypothetical protein FHR70_003505 [Microvirga lupini]|uniref:HNH nuclease domain-containing protein n=1 Tax=Microvirga lupini TaxID=420324 RepID=A0A7W4VNH1_9HYPH|nr:HNH endonuclease [Microvirga lupini]MBB3020424.1 hypothetical protein [Microvirga lupini]
MAWRDDVQAALEAIGGQGALQVIYNAVEQIRRRNGGTLPPSWQAVVRRELEYNSSDSESYQGRFDLFYSVNGIGGGVWGLRALERLTPVAVDSAEPDSPLARMETYRILRDTVMARRVKKLHQNTCQICSTVIQLSAGQSYSEAHHIRPLGRPHNGPDIPENILVVCPTHHVLCDYGAIKLDEAMLTKRNGHTIDPKFLNYHNTSIFESVIDDEV